MRQRQLESAWVAVTHQKSASDVAPYAASRKLAVAVAVSASFSSAALGSVQFELQEQGGNQA